MARSRAEAEVTAHSLTCGGLRDPVGLDEARPRFGWQIRGKSRGALQTGYQVQLSHGAELLWDTGRVASSSSLNVACEAPALGARKRHSWRVRVWDGTGLPSPWSPVASFETGLLDEQWRATWIGRARHGLSDAPPATLFRRAFVLPNAPLRARLYINARGIFEALDQWASRWTECTRTGLDRL